MNTPKTIVIIEDNESVRSAFARFFKALECEHELIFLTTLDEAEIFLDEVLPNRNDIIAITFDGSMIPGNHSLNTLHLVQLALNANFTGIMMACSTDDFYRDQLVQKGCTHKASCKSSMPTELLELLQ